MRLLIVFVLMFVSGCATTKPIEPEKIAQIRKVGAVSLLGERLNIVQVGTTVFNNVNTFEDVPGWNVDEFAVGELKTFLGNDRPYTFVPITYQQKQLSSIYKSKDRFPYADFDIDYIRDQLVKIKGEYEVDTLVLLLSSRRDTTGNGHYLHGFGVFSRSLLGVEVGSTFTLGATLAVIDLNTLEILSTSPVSLVKRLERGIWKESVSRYSPEELDLLKNYLFDGIKSAVPVSLEKLGLQGR